MPESSHTGRKRFAIVGAGLGGLALALRLAHRGHDVTVYEKNDGVGGRNRSLTVGECHFDGGPTLLMMLDPFRKLFADVGEDFDQLLAPKLCEPTYRVFFADKVRIDATTNVEAMTNRLRAISSEADAAKYPAFLKELQELYEVAIPNFVRNDFDTASKVIDPRQLQRVLKHHMLQNLAGRIKRRFADPKLHMLFSFQTMYLGLSPYEAPWVYSTLAYMEYGEGIYYPQGGLSRISDVVAELAQDRGAKIHLNCPVDRIRPDGVDLSTGVKVDADIVISNADFPYSKRDLANLPLRRTLSYSCSALLYYIEYEGELETLLHHNVFFGSDFEGNLDALFRKLRYHSDPAFYVCISKRTDPAAAPDGRLNLMVLIPVPNLQYTPSEEECVKLKDCVFERLAKEVGFNAKNIRHMKERGPQQWRDELNLDEGAAFGISAKLVQSAFMRPSNRDSSSPNLFYVGASTMPGNGLPMVLISAELVEQRLVAAGVL
jgi:phytoene desaturase